MKNLDEVKKRLGLDGVLVHLGRNQILCISHAIDPGDEELAEFSGVHVSLIDKRNGASDPVVNIFVDEGRGVESMIFESESDDCRYAEFDMASLSEAGVNSNNQGDLVVDIGGGRSLVVEVEHLPGTPGATVRFDTGETVARVTRSDDRAYIHLIVYDKASVESSIITSKFPLGELDTFEKQSTCLNPGECQRTKIAVGIEEDLSLVAVRSDNPKAPGIKIYLRSDYGAESLIASVACQTGNDIIIKSRLMGEAGEEVAKTLRMWPWGLGDD